MRQTLIPVSKSTNNNIVNLFKSIDLNIYNYESKKSEDDGNFVPEPSKCECYLITKQKNLELQFYSKQKELIESTLSCIKVNPNLQENQLLFIKVFNEMICYLQKILELQQKKILCSCKLKQLSESITLQHNLNFLREENQRIFECYQEKNEQCEELKKIISNYRESYKMNSNVINSNPLNNVSNNQSTLQPDNYQSKLSDIRTEQNKLVLPPNNHKHHHKQNILKMDLKKKSSLFIDKTKYII